VTMVALMLTRRSGFRQERADVDLQPAAPPR
jgi:hypothetical protein